MVKSKTSTRIKTSAWKENGQNQNIDQNINIVQNKNIRKNLNLQHFSLKMLFRNLNNTLWAELTLCKHGLGLAIK